GRFTLRLPPGRGFVLVWRVPGEYRQTDFRRPEGVVPEGVGRFENKEPVGLGKGGVVAAALGKPAAPCADPAAGPPAGATELEALYVWDAGSVSDAGVAHLAGLPKLRSVHVSKSGIGDGALAVFARMPSLQKLSLQGNNFSDAGLKHLAGMTQLQPSG